jgi:hypothetical protein
MKLRDCDLKERERDKFLSTPVLSLLLYSRSVNCSEREGRELLPSLSGSNTNQVTFLIVTKEDIIDRIPENK